MSSFFHRFFRSARDPRYRVLGPVPFPSFDDYLFALEAAYIARGLPEHPCLPQNGKEFKQARKDFRDRYYPRLEWPDWLAAVLFFGTCQAVLLIAVMLSHWGVIAPTVLFGVLAARAWQESRRQRQWQADMQRYLHARHIRRQRTVNWQFQ
jgi:hypothetical protein